MKEYKQFFSEASSSSGETGGRMSPADKARRTKARNAMKNLNDKGKQVRGDQAVHDIQGKKTDLQKRMETSPAAKRNANKDTYIQTREQEADEIIKSLGNEKKREEADKSTPAKRYGRSETEKEAARAAEREKIQAPEVRRKAAQEPVSFDKVKKNAQARVRKRLGSDKYDKKTTKPGLGDYAAAGVSTRIKKEKERFKTDPVGQTKKYASGVAGAAKATARAMNPNSSGVSKTGGGSSTERGVRYQ